MDTLQVSAHFHMQLTVLWVVLYFFPLAGFSTPAFLVFIFAWLLSDLASSVCLFELNNSIRKLKGMPAIDRSWIRLYLCLVMFEITFSKLASFVKPSQAFTKKYK